MSFHYLKNKSYIRWTTVIVTALSFHTYLQIVLQLYRQNPTLEEDVQLFLASHSFYLLKINSYVRTSQQDLETRSHYKVGSRCDAQWGKGSGGTAHGTEHSRICCASRLFCCASETQSLNAVQKWYDPWRGGSLGRYWPEYGRQRNQVEASSSLEEGVNYWKSGREKYTTQTVPVPNVRPTMEEISSMREPWSLLHARTFLRSQTRRLPYNLADVQIKFHFRRNFSQVINV